MAIIKDRDGNRMLAADDGKSVRATLEDASWCGWHFRHADLRGADLRGARLDSADLRYADLRHADLRGAAIRGARLDFADLRYADLRGVQFEGINLQNALLSGALMDDDLADSLTIVPKEGEFEAWKKCRSGVLVRLLIPATSRRSNATTRKCRAEAATVLEVVGADYGVSLYNSLFLYVPGASVLCDRWEEDRWVECGGGIHFFLTREEAERYDFS